MVRLNLHVKMQENQTFLLAIYLQHASFINKIEKIVFRSLAKFNISISPFNIHHISAI